MSAVGGPHDENSVQAPMEIWDGLRMAARLHEVVADSVGYQVDLSLTFAERAERAVDALTATANDQHASPALVGDCHRKLALLLPYLLREAARAEQALTAAETHADLALRSYDRLVSAVGGKMASASGGDEHAATLCRLERCVVKRQLGSVAAAHDLPEASDEILSLAGLAHIRAEILCELALREAQLGRDWTDIYRTALAASEPFPREHGETLFVGGALNAMHGSPEEAVRFFRGALAALRSSRYSAEDELDQTLHTIAMHYGAGVMADEEADAVQSLDEAVRTIETVRAGWMLGSTPSDPFSPIFRRIEDEGVRVAVSGVLPGSTEVGIRLLEARRRRSLAGWMRSGQIAGTSLLSAVSDVRDQIMASEAMRPGLLNRPRIDISNGWLGSQGDPLEQALREASTAFLADAYLPDPVDVSNVIERGAQHHRLIFQLDGAQSHGMATGRRAWIAPQGVVEVDPFAIDVTPSEIALWEASPLGTSPIGVRLAASLLPPALLTELNSVGAPSDAENLCICPDGPLASLSWPGLETRPGHPLVRSTNIAFTPALSLTGPTARDTSVSDPIVALISSSRTGPLEMDAERRYWSRRGATIIEDLDSLATELRQRGGTAPLAYVASHGVRSRLGSSLVDDDTELSAFDLFEVPWPSTVVMAGCFTAYVDWDVESGYSPLGLPLACLARGADNVIGGAAEIVDHIREGGEPVAAVFYEDLLSKLAAGLSPTHALAECQRSWVNIHSTGLKSAPAVWARNICFTKVVP